MRVKEGKRLVFIGQDQSGGLHGCGRGHAVLWAVLRSDGTRLC